MFQRVERDTYLVQKHILDRAPQFCAGKCHVVFQVALGMVLGSFGISRQAAHIANSVSTCGRSHKLMNLGLPS
jgi:hypothetical protein